MKRPGAVLVAAGLLLMAACSGDERAWTKAREKDTSGSYAAYIEAHPRGSHVAAAIDQTKYLDRKSNADRIFMGLKDLENKVIDPTLRILVLTVEADGTYQINKSPIDSSLLEKKLKEIIEPRQDKTLFFRFLKPVKSYREIVDLIDLLLRSGVEYPVPISSPGIREIVSNEFKGAVELPILDESISGRAEEGNPEEIAESEIGVLGGIEGGVEGEALAGVPEDAKRVPPKAAPVDEQAPVRPDRKERAPGLLPTMIVGIMMVLCVNIAGYLPRRRFLVITRILFFVPLLLFIGLWIHSGFISALGAGLSAIVVTLVLDPILPPTPGIKKLIDELEHLPVRSDLDGPQPPKMKAPGEAKFVSPRRGAGLAVTFCAVNLVPDEDQRVPSGADRLALKARKSARYAYRLVFRVADTRYLYVKSNSDAADEEIFG